MTAASLRRGAALAAVLAVAGAADAAAKPVAEPPSRLLVTAREFSLTLSRQKIDPGEAIVQLYDFGEDPHDLAIQRVGGATIFTIPEIAPGEAATLNLRLRKSSRYRLWCSLPDHAEKGMFASLRTARKKAGA